jgi:manganese-dependent ADP-ribose/CDP-alcohol diphosphatase
VGAAPFISRAATTTGFEIGLVTDAQYVDAEPRGSRFYREGRPRLAEAVEHFNRRDLAFCVQLGDLIDRDWESFDAMMEPLARSRHPWHHVLGNHDFDVADEWISRVPHRLGLTRRYEAFDQGAFRFVRLDTNDVSTYAYPVGTPERVAAAEELERIKAKGWRHAQPWNGGVGAAQLAWLDRTCAEAHAQGRQVIIFAHHPAAPADQHNVWNTDELLALIDRHRNVVAWFNGHNHAGAFEERQGASFVTLRGMVETADTTAYATAQLLPDRMIITGYGREPSRELVFRSAR